MVGSWIATHCEPKTGLDRGSPNMAYGTRALIKNLEMLFSPDGVNRPTDNARKKDFTELQNKRRSIVIPAILH